MDDSTIISDEIIDVKKRILMKKSNLYNAKFLYFTCILLITIAIMLAVSIYCYLIKYWAKNLLPFHDTKLKQFCIDNINWKRVLKI